MTEEQRTTQHPLRPLAVLGVRCLLGITDLARTAWGHAREEVEDILAEAHFEHMKKKMDAEISGDPTEEQPPAAKEQDKE